MANGLLPGVVDAVERVTARAADADELLEGVATQIGKVVPYDGAMWFGLDPTTMLAVSPARMEHLDDGYCSTFWFGEFHEHDANLFADLARGVASAARRCARPPTISRAQRPVPRVLAAPGLRRRAARRVPHRREVLGCGWALPRAGARSVRRARRRRPGSRLADRGGSVPLPCRADRAHAQVHARAGTDAVQPRRRDHFSQRRGVAWLAEIYGSKPGTNWFELLAGLHSPDVDAAIPIIPLIAPAHAVASGRDNREARLRLRDRSARWLVLHASLLYSPSGDDNVAIVVEPAKSGDLAPIIIEAYGLTPRERDVVRAIARGTSTPDIAAELYLSAHTVRDYINTAFEKVGVTSRGELVSPC